MFRRLFWFAAGASTGVWATVKVNRAVRRLTPGGLAATAADRATELGARARRFALDVRTGMTEREAELGEALGIEPAAGPAQLPGQRPQIAVTRHPHNQSYNQKEGH
ncbi:DUF6167 family protein [Streptomyces sp. SL13]|jgi:hypothetical protein|uniref:DUF6167 family protein n=1 Tax=Streptantibioticus silvisoli TaxID=2705255 RepID=A0AA90HC39_9ACTN|nr:DUF6167 family protein [Streptantibioticus silvisoli]MDI5964683.1 DUF6167 family protein [Streptantibioticus silvisoli]MDI5972157.1 DUF6167 family protein [Streptantibioticus silvisoli]